METFVLASCFFVHRDIRLNLPIFQPSSMRIFSGMCRYNITKYVGVFLTTRKGALPGRRRGRAGG